MNKNEYLKNTVVCEFVEFFEQVTNGIINIDCDYTPSSNKKNPFYAGTVEQALENYIWAGKNYDENKKILDGLSEKLKVELVSKNNFSVLTICLKILVWGEVYRGSVGWLAEIAEKGVLIERVNKSIELMDSCNIDQIDLFNENKILRCDSGTTKIFSLGSKKSIIYDGRVACALGMLIIDYLTRYKFKTIPSELNFLMDSDSKRNPSIKSMNFKFISKSQKSKGLNHAISSIKLNWIVEKVVSSQSFQWKCYGLNANSSLMDKMRALEAAFFMIGYKSERSKYLDKGFYLVPRL